MSDPFNILGPEPDPPKQFDEAVREAIASFQAAAERFQGLAALVEEDDLTEHEWQIVERAAEELADSVERAEEGYIAVQYDSHAWYRILESLERIRLRLDSASGLLENARARAGRP